MVEATAPVGPKPIPPEIQKWNWGAFLLNWIWGIGNNTFIALLTLIPFFGTFIMPFVLGAKGNKWAWQNGRWDSVEHFRRVQRLWAIWGAVIWVGVILFYGAIIGFAFYALKSSEAYRLGVAKIEQSPVAATALGSPISCGFPFGSVNITPSSGHAVLSFSAIGSKATGQVSLEADKRNGQWSLTHLTLTVGGTKAAINLLGQANDNGI
jgi:hypothetical protein